VERGGGSFENDYQKPDKLIVLKVSPSCGFIITSGNISRNGTFENDLDEDAGCWHILPSEIQVEIKFSN
jgi:hypothetical protein